MPVVVIQPNCRFPKTIGRVQRLSRGAVGRVRCGILPTLRGRLPVTEAWVWTTHAVGQRVTPFVRIYSSITVSQLASEIISIDLSLRTEENTSVGSLDSDIRHCNQAEANDAAAAQMAAQTPSDDNKTSIQNASLVSARAI